jgi:hypothetical protein
MMKKSKVSHAETDPKVKAWEECCDAIEATCPIEALAARIEASLVRAHAIVKSAVTVAAAKSGLPTTVVDELNAGLDNCLALRRMDVASWLYEEQRSRRIARSLGRLILLGHGYVTTGESNWLTHPAMRGLRLLRDSMRWNS